MDIVINPNDIRYKDGSSNRGLSISVRGFNGSAEAAENDPSQLYLEVKDDKLLLYVWNNTYDPIMIEFAKKKPTPIPED